MSPGLAGESNYTAATSIGDLTRGNLRERVVQVLNTGRSRNPDVFVAETAGGVVVVKDFSPRGPIVRNLIGPWINRREIRAYEALAGHPAIPAYLGELDRFAFVVGYRPGRYLSRRLAHEVRPEFLDEVEGAIADMHARGVVHLDLRHRTNILLGRDGHPVLIDFASAICAYPGGFLARLLVATLGFVDRLAIQKWRARLTPPS